jgi:hypothetical protein
MLPQYIIGAYRYFSYNRRHFSAKPIPKGAFGATGHPL